VDRVIDAKRVELLLDGYSSYSASARSLTSEKREESPDDVKLTASTQSLKLSIERLEFFSDQIIDLLFVSNGNGVSPSSFANRTPLQKLVIEELSKIIGALSRQSWGNLRSRSGILPSGRSVLGLLVDPLGLFQESPLFSIDQYDRKIIESSKTILTLLQKSVPGEALNISPQDSVRFLNVLMGKLWGKRREVAVFGTGVAAQLIENSITRLDLQGEKRRSRRVLRGSGQQNFQKVFNNEVEMPTVVSVQEKEESARLRNARNLVSKLRNDNMSSKV